MSVTPRDFLKSAGVTSLATAVTTAAAPDGAAQTGPRVVGPGEVPVALTVNGKRLELTIEPRVTLLDALRTRADLTGNKRVCDRGTCGACTMIVPTAAPPRATAVSTRPGRWDLAGWPAIRQPAATYLMSPVTRWQPA